jgi:hypothetical protein
MLKVWLYGFAVNVRSTRKLERRIQEDLGFRYLAGGLRPDHKRLSEFLRRQGAAIEELFTQVLGGARLGRVAIDSTRIRANASPDRLQEKDRPQVGRWRRAMERAKLRTRNRGWKWKRRWRNAYGSSGVSRWARHRRNEYRRAMPTRVSCVSAADASLWATAENWR